MAEYTVSTLPWLATLERAASADALRRALLERHRAFAPDRLREVAVVGAADEGRRLIGLCDDRGIVVRAVVDDDPRKLGARVGHCVVTPVESLATFDRSLPVVIASHRVLGALDRLRTLGFRDVAPFALLQVLDPSAFPPHMFYDSWLDDLVDHRTRYLELSDRLADDASRRVLDAVLGFRLTLDADVLRPVIEWDLYAPAGLLTYGADEVYVDGGSYDGDTIRLFIERVHGRFTRVLAFEPDRATFQRLAANFADDKRVEPINAGLHRSRATLRFDNAGTRGSTLVEHGGIEIPVVGLDEILEGDRVTFIKMNIEAAEIEALHGAAASIRRWRPTLAISAYHRPSHLWEVAAAIRTLHAGYRLFLRQHDGGVIETVVYALEAA